jgi:hypothetical protein
MEEIFLGCKPKSLKKLCIVILVFLSTIITNYSYQIIGKVTQASL